MKYTYYGIRGTDTKHEIGETLETSYVWDYEMDRCTYGEDNEEELGGVCVTFVSDRIEDGEAPDFSSNDMFETEDELNAAIEKAIEFAKSEQGGYEHYYLVGSDERNPLNMQEADEGEAILADAVVLKEV